MKKPLDLWLRTFLIATPLLLSATSAWAGKYLDASAGFYSLTATTSKTSGSLSGPGLYRLSYRQGVADHLEFSAGYSLLFASVITGDMSYGPDLGLNFYPLTLAGPVQSDTPNIKFQASEVWRPFTSLTFHQRQFRSVDSSYAGFSVGAGSAYQWSSELCLRAEFRYLSLSGPSSASASSTELTVGASFPF